ncbi:MAG: BatD family protein [bacterium]|nr:BatD family protein [bacterium]
MFRRFFFAFLFIFLTISSLMGQGVRVSLPNGTLYAGEPLNITLSAEGEQLATADLQISPKMSMHVTGSRMFNLNGRVTSSLILTGVPKEAGTYTISMVRATTSNGEVLTSNQKHSFNVSTLQQDEEVQWSVDVSPNVIYVGDRYVVTYTLRVPALKVNGKWESPFLQRSFFDDWTLARPRVEITLPDLQVATQRVSERVEGTTYIYECICEIVANQAGKVLLYGGLLPRQQRATSIENNSIRFKDTYAVGTPIEVEISQPPEEGRPLHWTGAIAKTFRVSARVDALNVVVEDPVKLTIDILTDADEKMLRTMPLGDLPDFHFLADPEREQIEGGCRFVYTFRPLKDGLLELPPLPFSFFNREREAYETVYTPVIPLRVMPMPKLFYTFGDVGTLRLESHYPPPMRTVSSEQPKLTISSRVVWTLLGAIVLLVMVSFKRLWVWCLRVLMTPLSWCVPKMRLRMRLLSVRSPEEALGVVRWWTRRPALTPEELERMQTSPSAHKVADAMRELEAARYASDTTQCKDAIKTLRQHLVKLKFLFVLFFSMVGFTLTAKPESYQWEQAQVTTTRCEEMTDFRVAANYWLTLIHYGDLSKHALLNASSTAFLAAEPKVARCLVRHCEELHGRDDDTKQMTAAIDLYQGQAETGLTPWLLAFHLKFSYGVRLDGLVFMLALVCFSFAIRIKAKRVRRILRLIRIGLCLALFLVAMSVWETVRWRASHEIPEKLPALVSMEDAQQ